MMHSMLHIEEQCEKFNAVTINLDWSHDTKLLCPNQYLSGLV